MSEILILNNQTHEKNNFMVNDFNDNNDVVH